MAGSGARVCRLLRQSRGSRCLGLSTSSIFPIRRGSIINNWNAIYRWMGIYSRTLLSRTHNGTGVASVRGRCCRPAFWQTLWYFLCAGRSMPLRRVITFSGFEYLSSSHCGILWSIYFWIFYPSSVEQALDGISIDEISSRRRVQGPDWLLLLRISGTSF